MTFNITRRQFGKGAAATAAVAATGVPFASQAATVLKYSNAGPGFTTTNQFAGALFEEVGRRTGGEITAEILAGSLGLSEEQTIESMSLGTIDVYSGAFTGTREYDIFYSPYMFRDASHAGLVANGVLRGAGAAALESRWNAKFLGVGRAGPWTLFLNEKIDSFEDLRGRKIRAPAIEGLVKGLEFLGAEPTVIPFSEAKNALATGVVDGMTTLSDLAIVVGFQEVTQFMMRGEFSMGLDKFAMNRASWDAMTPDQQDILVGTFAQMENDFLHKPTEARLPQIYADWEEANGPGSVFDLDASAATATMEPLNREFADEVYGPGSWDAIVNS